MRLLHTSDWHLGRTLHGVVLHDAQERVLEQLCDLVEDPLDGVPVDAVLVSGDVYDRGVPPIESVRLFERVLARLAATTTVVVTSGNHDSAVRLGFGASLFTDRVRVLTDPDPRAVATPVLLERDGVTTAVYGIPYLDPDHARVLYAGDEGPLPRSHQAVVSAAVARIREDADARRAADPGLRCVVMAHAFVGGAEPSTSERSIAVGGVERVAVSAFAGVDYAALGHLHGPQDPGGAEAPVRYCGSPLRYSFSEEKHEKGILLVDVPATGPVTAVRVTLEQPRPMATIRGELAALLADPDLADAEGAWVRAYVTDRTRPDGLMDRLTSRFPHALQVVHEPATGALSTRGTTVASEADPRVLGKDFIEYVTGADASDGEIGCVVAAYEATHRADAQAGVAIGAEGVSA